MINALRQPGGLNPRGYRAYCHAFDQPRQNVKRGIIDGPILWKFCDLDLLAQKELAKCIGSTPEVVIQNLLEIQLATASCF